MSTTRFKDITIRQKQCVVSYLWPSRLGEIPRVWQLASDCDVFKLNIALAKVCVQRMRLILSFIFAWNSL